MGADQGEHRIMRDIGARTKIAARNVSVSYGEKSAIRNISLDILENRITALIGPSGCGKTTFLRSMNRMNEIIPGAVTRGTIMLNGKNIYDKRVDPVILRKNVGMVFQRPNPFPKSIYDNVAYGAKIDGMAKSKADMDVIVERALLRADLWDEVKDRLREPGTALSGGQQQRLCIARTLAVEPNVMLMDEPCSSLDPIATAKIEQTLGELKRDTTIVVVTHSMSQAKRVSDKTAFFYMGDLVETGDTDTLFVNPKEKRTEEFITGRFG